MDYENVVQVRRNKLQIPTLPALVSDQLGAKALAADGYFL